MPTVRRIGSARFFFYGNKAAEPPHIHVEQAGAVAKFWLEPIALARNKGFAEHELGRIRQILTEHQHELIRIWHDYFSA